MELDNLMLYSPKHMSNETFMYIQYMCSIGINRNSNKTSFINDFNQDTVNKEAFNYAKNDSESDQYDVFLFCEMFTWEKKSELV